jgi:cell division protein FtsI (penicillin-binding protein 3)
MTLRDVIRHSSNIGIVKLAQRLTPREQYEAMRDLGFGTAHRRAVSGGGRGHAAPAVALDEAVAASLAMGYEMAATPLQLAAAYGAVANGGELLEPALVKEVRDADGAVRYRHARRVVRRVMPAAIAAEVRTMLKSVVDSGTATGADLASFTVGGKSGTVRRIERGRGYAAGHYNAVFAGIFPVEDPQFVIIVKLDNPAGVYYGGKIAAPVTKVVLEAALAARDAALDRGALAGRVEPQARAAYAPRPDTARRAPAARVASASPAPAPPPVAVVPAELRRESAAVAATGPVRVVVDLAAPGARMALHAAADGRAAATGRGPARAVPAVQGLPVRDAVFALHRAGFRVRVAGTGPDSAGARTVGRPAGRTVPAAGAATAPGALVTLYRAP